MQGTQAGLFAGVVVTAFVIGVSTTESVQPLSAPSSAELPTWTAKPHTGIGARGISTSALSGAVKTYCGQCHNARTMRGNLNLDGYDVDSAVSRLDASEKMIRKLRAQIMPPPGSRKP